ncbi:hypothetical protein [Arthrobacter sp. Marseille-P9274]|nr:hypothetical protein [Arthrobacter sp. Marseille-P9274]
MTTVHGVLTPQLAVIYRAAAREVSVVAISHRARSPAPVCGPRP